MKKIITITLLATLTLCLFAQAQTTDSTKNANKKYVKTLNLNVENGTVLSNGSTISDQLIDASYYNGVDLRLGFRKTNPKDTYSNIYRRPTLGVGYYSSTFRNPNIGTPTALYFFLDMPFAFAEQKKLTYSYTAAFGISYNFTPYDSVNNPSNILIGSYKNCYVHLGFSAHYKLNEQWALNGTVGFKHFSNGSFKQPNYGINLLPVTVGATYKFGNNEVTEYKTPVPKYIRHNLYNVSMTVGSKNYEIGETNYLKLGWGFNYLRQINHRYRIGAGLDVYYAAAAELRSDSGEGGFSESYSFAVVGSWEWVITDRLYAPLGIGYYIHRNTSNDEQKNYYERAGLRYRITDHLAAGLTIKAHGGVADIFEWTVAYTFHDDPNSITR